MCHVSRESVQWLTTEVRPGNKESKEHAKKGPSLTLGARHRGQILSAIK